MKRKNEEKETLTFKGYWNNNTSEPAVTLTIAGCEDGKAMTILQDLDIATPGEDLFLNQGENPQKRLDHWLAGAVRRKKPDVEDFKKEIDAFDDTMLEERRESLYEKVSQLIEENKEDTKAFDFYLDCLNAIVEKSDRYYEPYAKEELIEYVRGFDTSTSEDTDDWETPTTSEEEE